MYEYAECDTIRAWHQYTIYKKGISMNRNWIRLPLEGAHNVRDMGGLPVKGGGQTAWHRFLRSDFLTDLTKADVELLLDYGVTTIIDLRSFAEVEKEPDSPLLCKQVKYYAIPFMQEDLSPEGQSQNKRKILNLSELYVFLLEQKAVIKQLFECIEDAPNGCILFHCTAGKDRTGVLAMLLLMLSGTDKQDCQTNYMQSFINLSRKEKFMKIKNSEYNSLIMSEPDSLEAAYDIVAGWNGGIEGFLKDCGITAECIARVKARCIEA